MVFNSVGHLIGRFRRNIWLLAPESSCEFASGFVSGNPPFSTTSRRTTTSAGVDYWKVWNLEWNSFCFCVFCFFFQLGVQFSLLSFFVLCMSSCFLPCVCLCVVYSYRIVYFTFIGLLFCCFIFCFSFFHVKSGFHFSFFGWCLVSCFFISMGCFGGSSEGEDVGSGVTGGHFCVKPQWKTSPKWSWHQEVLGTR